MKKKLDNFLAKLPKLSLKKKIFIFFIFLLAAAAVFVLQNSNKKADYKTEKVKLRNIEEIIDESGTVTTTSKIDVYSPSKGIIEELYVENGDIVGIDQELFRVKSTATEDEKAVAAASLLTAKNSLKTAEQNKMAIQVQLEQARNAVLDARKASDDMINDASGSYTQMQRDIIDSDLTTAYWNFNTIEKKYLEADTAISAARASLSSASLDYESTKDRIVKSTAIGTISNLSVSAGDSVLAAAPANANTLSLSGVTSATSRPVLSIANFTSNSVVAKINESDISNIEVGQSAIIYPDALRDVKYTGKIKRVDDIGVEDDGVVVYNTYIDITDSDAKLKSGMTVDVQITTRKLNQVLTVTNSAVKPYKGGRAVRVYNSKTDKIDYLPVVVGLKGQTYTQIIDGVSSGQEVITSLSQEDQKSGFFGM